MSFFSSTLDAMMRLTPFERSQRASDAMTVRQPGDKRTYGEVVRDATARFDMQDPPGRATGVLNWLRQAVGGWPGAEMAHGKKAGAYVGSEKAASGPRGVKIPAFLPYIDEYTGETEQMRLWYRRMLRDPIVKAALYGKTFDVASLDLHVNPFNGGRTSKDRKAARYNEWNLTQRMRGKTPASVVDVCLPGLVDGYSVCEKVWAYQETGMYAGKYVLDKLKQKDAGSGNDVVLVIDEYRNITSVMGLRYNQGQQFSPQDFVIFRYMPLFEYPGGTSDLRAVYADYWMYDTVRKLRAICLEKRAMPFLMGTYRDIAQRPSLETVLARIRWDNWIAAPEWAKVTAIETAGSAIDMYQKAIEDLKQNIFIGIQGAFLQSLEGKGANVRGDSSVQKSTSELFNWFLMVCYLAAINEQVVPDICDLNYSGLSGYPEAVMGGINEGELGKALIVDQGLLGMGLPLSKKAMYKKYGRQAPMSKEDALMPASQLAPEQQPQQQQTERPHKMDDPTEGKGVWLVDLDKTLAEYDGWRGHDHVGEMRTDPLSGLTARDFMRRIQAKGKKAIVFTAREELEPVKRWLEANDIPNDGVTNRKIPAEKYIDDRAENALRTSWSKILDEDPTPAKQAESHPTLDAVRKHFSALVAGGAA